MAPLLSIALSLLAGFFSAPGAPVPEAPEPIPAHSTPDETEFRTRAESEFRVPSGSELRTRSDAELRTRSEWLDRAGSRGSEPQTRFGGQAVTLVARVGPESGAELVAGPAGVTSAPPPRHRFAHFLFFATAPPLRV